MSDEKQYFDKLETNNGYIWAVDEISGTKTPLKITAISSSDTSSSPSELILQQYEGGWWYSRKKYESVEEVNKAFSEVSSEIIRLSQSRWRAIST